MNKVEILKNMEIYIKQLARLSGIIAGGRLNELKEYIKKSRILRESIK